MFVALEVNEAVKRALTDLSQRLRPCEVKASWVRPEHMHLTLRFLSEVDDDTAKRLGDILNESYLGVAPFVLRASGVGVFPNLRRPSVVWAGVKEPTDEPLKGLWRIIEDASRAVGLPAETKRFHPHLTLARVRDQRQPGRLGEYLAREKDFDGGEITVDRVALFSSKLTPGGPIHRLIKEFRF